MPHRPTPAEFTAFGTTHTVVPVYRQLVADTLTPVSAFAKIRGEGWAFLFESVVGGERVGRYSFLGAGPFRTFEAYGHRVREVASSGEVMEIEHPDPLKLLEERIATYRAPNIAGLPRFCGGAVGFAGYDAVRYVEKLPNAPPDDRGIPDLCFGFYDRMVIFDHINKTVNVVAHGRIEPGLDIAEVFRGACAAVDELVEQLRAPTHDLPLTDIRVPKSYSLPERFRSNFTRESWHAMMAKGIEYILAGDVFQYVPSQRFETTTTARPFDIYRALRVINPSPFMFYVNAGPTALVGASPEILCRVENGKMTVRPLAGTRKRGDTPEDDAALAVELLADPKERAEHIMLVDLGRNDIGRVAQTGSVRVTEQMVIERYSHVMHIVSNVEAKLKPGLTAIDVLRATFPAGTVSGAPKVRAMEIIDELEPVKRGVYAGAVGYLGFNGDMDVAIALRTAVVKDGMLHVQAGGGVVADSVPQAEWQETQSKAQALLRAAELAEAGLDSRVE